MDRKVLEHIVVDGVAKTANLLCVAIKDPDLVEDEIPHARFVYRYGNEWGWMCDKKWEVVDTCISDTDEQLVVFLGEEGSLLKIGKGYTADSSLPDVDGVYRGISFVDDTLYVCGMKNLVYQLATDEEWIKINPDGFDASFETVSGVSNEEIYFAGWKGVICQFNGVDWKKIDSPTNFILTCSGVTEDKKVVIAGQQGTILIGRGEEWKVVETEVIDDFWDVAVVGEKIYVSSMTTVYALDTEAEEKLNVVSPDGISAGKLAHSEGVLWSIGCDDVGFFDGESWTWLDDN